MKNWLIALFAAAALAGCGGGGSDPAPARVAASNTTLSVDATVAGAVVNTPFVFSGGVPALGTTATTTVVFTSSGTTPAFTISSGGNTASGVTTFGSCIFRVSNSTFPAGHPLANGQTVTVNPCNANVATQGAIANGVATSRSVALLLGAAASAGATVMVGVTSTGALVLNGANIVTTIALTFVTGGS